MQAEAQRKDSGGLDERLQRLQDEQRKWQEHQGT